MLALVSWFAATNLAGTGAGVAYGVGIVVATVVVLPWLTDRVRRAPPWVLPVVVAVVVAVLVVAFVLGPPAADARALGVGSDRANALDVAVTRLLAGDYPWAATTYLGNPLSPLPGAMLMATPFVLLTGSAAAQNVVWTVLLLPVLNGGLRLRPGPTLLWALVVLGGLEVLREFLVGDDLVVSSVPALVAVLWTLRVAEHGSTRRLVLAAAVLGLATCTRPHLALVVVVVAVAAGTLGGWRRGVLVGGVAALVWTALIVPFLLGGLARFTPLHVAAKVTGERGLSAGIVVVAAAALALLAVVLVIVRPSTPAEVAWLCAAILVAPTVLSVVRHALSGGEPADVTLGVAAVPFVGCAHVRDLLGYRPEDHAQGRSPYWSHGSVDRC